MRTCIIRRNASGYFCTYRAYRSYLEWWIGFENVLSVFFNYLQLAVVHNVVYILEFLLSLYRFSLGEI